MHTKIDLYGWLILIITFVAVLFFALNAPAQWEEVPAEGTTLDFGGLFTDTASSYTAQAIHAGESYWIGAQASQIRADGETKAQDIAARAQKGFGFWGVSAEFYVEANRNLDTDLTTSTGGYLRKVFAYDKLKLVFGAGSLLEREEVRADYGLEAVSPTTLPYWITIAAAEYDVSETIDMYAKVVGQPAIALNAFDGTLDIGLDIVLSERLTLKLQSVSEVSIDNKTDSTLELSGTENSLLLSLNY